MFSNFFSKLFKTSLQIESEKTIQYTALTSELLIFNTTIIIKGNSGGDLTWQEELLNARTENPIPKTEVPRKAGGLTTTIKCGGCTIIPSPMPPWNVNGRLEVHIAGNISASPVGNYLLIGHIYGPKGSTHKFRINLGPKQ